MNAQDVVSLSWELLPLPPVDYRPLSTASTETKCADTSSRTGNEKKKKKKRPVTVALTSGRTVGREDILRSAISACGECNPLGKKRRPPGGACQHCQTILECGGRFLSKKMARFDPTPEPTKIRMYASGLNAKAIQVNGDKLIVGRAGNDNNNGLVEMGTLVRSGDIVSFLVKKRVGNSAADVLSLRFIVKCSEGETKRIGERTDDKDSRCLSCPSLPAAKRVDREVSSLFESCRQSDYINRDEVDLDRLQESSNDETGILSQDVKNRGDDERGDGNDEYNELENNDYESPMLSMHHFSASQWQNHSVDATFTDTPVRMHEESSGELSSERMSSQSRRPVPGPTIPGICSKSSQCKKDAFDVQFKQRRDAQRRLLSSLDRDEWRELLDEYSLGISRTTGIGPAVTRVSAAEEQCASSAFHQALLSMAIHRSEGCSEEPTCSQTALPSNTCSDRGTDRASEHFSSDRRKLFDLPHLLIGTTFGESE